MKKILVFDNYDSFTYNLVHYIENIIKKQVDVYRNDEISLEKVDEYDKILLSPGPGIPQDAGIMIDLIKKYAPSKSILGVCLGHQAIGEALGAKLEHMEMVFHGIASETKVTDPKAPLFRDIPETFMAGRYHSWSLNYESLAENFNITAVDNENRVMAIRHKKFDVRGMQYHPESVLTEHGQKMIANWLDL